MFPVVLWSSITESLQGDALALSLGPISGKLQWGSPFSWGWGLGDPTPGMLCVLADARGHNFSERVRNACEHAPPLLHHKLGTVGEADVPWLGVWCWGWRGIWAVVAGSAETGP